METDFIFMVKRNFISGIFYVGSCVNPLMRCLQEWTSKNSIYCNYLDPLRETNEQQLWDLFQQNRLCYYSFLNRTSLIKHIWLSIERIDLFFGEILNFSMWIISFSSWKVLRLHHPMLPTAPTIILTLTAVRLFSLRLFFFDYAFIFILISSPSNMY